MGLLDRARGIWNAFRQPETTGFTDYGYGAPVYAGGTTSPSVPRRRFSNERTIISSIYTRIGIDVASVPLRHVKTDDDGRYTEEMESPLNECLILEPNLDQGPRAFRQDIIATLFDKGVAALVPVDTTLDDDTEVPVDILSIRVGEITEWYPKHVKVRAYNEDKGVREEIVLPKKFCAIVENPLYGVMNEPNSTLQRLIRKLSMLDAVDEQSSSGKLDLIIQLPYTIKSEARRNQAIKRRDDIEFQLKDSRYGIAYADATEKITQLNRPVENNLLKQIEFLTTMLYGQLGITEEVMNGTADEKTMINYRNRTIEPLVDAIVEAMQRSFIGHIRSRKNEQIMYFMNPFKLVTLAELAEIGDKFTRNEILTGNDFRGLMGIKPSKDPKADELRNSNMPRQDTELAEPAEHGGLAPKEKSQNGSGLQRLRH